MYCTFKHVFQFDMIISCNIICYTGFEPVRLWWQSCSPSVAICRFILYNGKYRDCIVQPPLFNNVKSMHFDIVYMWITIIMKMHGYCTYRPKLKSLVLSTLIDDYLWRLDNHSRLWQNQDEISKWRTCFQQRYSRKVKWTTCLQLYVSCDKTTAISSFEGTEQPPSVTLLHLRNQFSRSWDKLFFRCLLWEKTPVKTS